MAEPSQPDKEETESGQSNGPSKPKGPARRSEKVLGAVIGTVGSMIGNVAIAVTDRQSGHLVERS